MIHLSSSAVGAFEPSFEQNKSPLHDYKEPERAALQSQSVICFCRAPSKLLRISRAEILSLSRAINKCGCQQTKPPYGIAVQRPFIKKDCRAFLSAGIEVLSYNGLSTSTLLQIIHVTRAGMLSHLLVIEAKRGYFKGKCFPSCCTEARRFISIISTGNLCP